MSKVALVSPPYLDAYTRNSRCDLMSPASSSWYPLWLGQAGCWLEGKGHQTILIDAQACGMKRQQALDAITSFNADIVAIYTGRLSEDSDIAFGDEIAATGRTVVFVGPYASANCSGLLAKAKTATLAIQREFDLPLEELASGATPLCVRNVWVKDHTTGAITFTPPRPLLKTETLDQFPLLTQYFNEHLNIRNYRIPSEPYPFIDVQSGRGCAWGRCDFCLWTHTFITGSAYNLRSIEPFMQEFDYIRTHMPSIKGVMVQDDMLTNRRALEIAEALIARKNKLRWSCYAKPNSKLTPETLSLMKKSGCLNLHVGFESGNNAILKEIDKGTTVEQALEFGAMVRESGLRLCGEFTFGHVGETEETMADTLRLAQAINPHMAHFLVMIPLHGTPYWDKLKQTGTLNAEGQPSFESVGGPSAKEINQTTKEAYRQFYVSGRYLKKVIQNPGDLFFKRLGLYARVLVPVLGRKNIYTARN
ncbi:MAG: radical SAM protein [Alphaproteobacteria bacterium]|nr:radical SAM protein [Alphaproteobacteria bacterium]